MIQFNTISGELDFPKMNYG